MREILFRGKREDCGEWGFGSLCKMFDGYHICDTYGTADRVIPETIGQYTGLTDKNGKKIFEGDIIEFTDKFTHKKGRAEIVFEAFKWKYDGSYYGGNPIVWLCIDDTSVEFEVIGNTYDNGEILEEKK